jgi:hypothetical protein
MEDPSMATKKKAKKEKALTPARLSLASSGFSLASPEKHLLRGFSNSAVTAVDHTPDRTSFYRVVQPLPTEDS